tara:strand:- start:706 stop:852 length:147 start_codon:yes stop_codon:yes gene_type:complete
MEELDGNTPFMTAVIKNAYGQPVKHHYGVKVVVDGRIIYQCPTLALMN